MYDDKMVLLKNGEKSLTFYSIISTVNIRDVKSIKTL